MPFTLTFHSIKEKIPAHEQEIAFFDTHVNGYGFQDMILKYGKVYYVWDNDNGAQWVYEGETEFVYDDGTRPEEGEIHLEFSIVEDGEGTSWQYGPVSNIKEYFAKRIYWVDFNELLDVVPEDGEEE